MTDEESIPIGNRVQSAPSFRAGRSRFRSSTTGWFGRPSGHLAPLLMLGSVQLLAGCQSSKPREDPSSRVVQAPQPPPEPTTYDQYYRRGWARLSHYEFGPAESDFTEALKLAGKILNGPNPRGAYSARATARALLARYDDALADLTAAAPGIKTPQSAVIRALRDGFPKSVDYAMGNSEWGEQGALWRLALEGPPGDLESWAPIATAFNFRTRREDIGQEVLDYFFGNLTEEKLFKLAQGTTEALAGQRVEIDTFHTGHLNDHHVAQNTAIAHCFVACAYDRSGHAAEARPHYEEAAKLCKKVTEIALAHEGDGALHEHPLLNDVEILANGRLAQISQGEAGPKSADAEKPTIEPNAWAGKALRLRIEKRVGNFGVVFGPAGEVQAINLPGDLGSHSHNSSDPYTPLSRMSSLKDGDVKIMGFRHEGALVEFVEVAGVLAAGAFQGRYRIHHCYTYKQGVEVKVEAAVAGDVASN